MPRDAKPPTLVHSDPEILGGTPVFVGTRVPAQTLFDYLEDGFTVDGFLENFSSVRREQAHAVLEDAAAYIVHGPAKPREASLPTL